MSASVQALWPIVPSGRREVGLRPRAPIHGNVYKDWAVDLGFLSFSRLPTDYYKICKLETRLAARLVGEKEAQEACDEEECTTDVDRRDGLYFGEHGDDRRHDAEDAVCRGCKGVASTAVHGREHLMSALSTARLTSGVYA